MIRTGCYTVMLASESFNLLSESWTKKRFEQWWKPSGEYLCTSGCIFCTPWTHCRCIHAQSSVQQGSSSQWQTLCRKHKHCHGVMSQSLGNSRITHTNIRVVSRSLCPRGTWWPSHVSWWCIPEHPHGYPESWLNQTQWQSSGRIHLCRPLRYIDLSPLLNCVSPSPKTSHLRFVRGSRHQNPPECEGWRNWLDLLWERHSAASVCSGSSSSGSHGCVACVYAIGSIARRWGRWLRVSTGTPGMPGSDWNIWSGLFDAFLNLQGILTPTTWLEIHTSVSASVVGATSPTKTRVMQYRVLRWIERGYLGPDPSQQTLKTYNKTFTLWVGLHHFFVRKLLNIA